MNNTFRFKAISPCLALLVLVSAVVCGCSDTSTSLEPADSGGSVSSFARLVTPDQLGMAGEWSTEALAPAIEAQEDVGPSLKAFDSDLMGTGSSVVDGVPVVLVLTRRPLATLPATARGCEVVQMVVDDINANAYYCGTSTGRADMCNAGTLGAIVTDGVRNYWLSNWHVFVRTAGGLGDAIDAPGRADVGCGPSSLVGTVSRWTPVKFDGTSNTVDCAIARIVPGVSVSRIQAAGPNSFAPSATSVGATVGQAVKKVGERTGFTTGRVTAVNVTTSINYSGIGAARFKGLIMFSNMAQPGDSGSLICTQSGNNPVALLFASNSSSTFGCAINPVLSAVGARFAN